MGHFYLSTHDKVYEGDTRGNDSESITSPYNFLNPNQQTFYYTNAPFSMTMVTLEPHADRPYQFTILSPGFYLYLELEQDEYTAQVLNRGQHQHNTYEIVYTRSGEYFQQIEARRHKYPPRSCCLLNRNIRHTEEYTTAFSTVTLSLSQEFLKNLTSDPFDLYFPDSTSSWQQNEEFQQFFTTELNADVKHRKSYLCFFPNYDITDETDPIHAIFDQLAGYIVNPQPGSSFLFRGLVCQMFEHLCNREQYSTNLINLGTEAESELFAQITLLMEETYGRISRTELTEKLNYSGHYLNRLVHKYSGMSIFNYGKYYTMQRAAFLLLHSDLTVSEIADQLGFTDRTHFYRLFNKEFGETPKQFRKRQHG